MLYINQLEHPEIPYVTDTDHPENREKFEHTISKAGCGICSMCMVVDQLTMDKLSIKKCRDLSYKSGANRGLGTDMKILGPYVAERYGLKYRTTSSIEQAARCLKRGGRVIVNVGGDREGYEGIFTHVGHFMVLTAAHDGMFTVLDPSFRPDKFGERAEQEGIRTSGRFVLCPFGVMAREADNRRPAYYLFEKDYD